MNKGIKVRIEKAEKMAFGSLDYILEMFPARDFVEIVGRIGGTDYEKIEYFNDILYL